MLLFAEKCKYKVSINRSLGFQNPTAGGGSVIGIGKIRICCGLSPAMEAARTVDVL
jgi:hypothetical protein